MEEVNYLFATLRYSASGLREPTVALTGKMLGSYNHSVRVVLIRKDNEESLITAQQPG